VCSTALVRHLDPILRFAYKAKTNPSGVLVSVSFI
jgi:hypothetical protein